MHDEALRLYNEPENHLIMESAAIVSAETVNSTRVQDTIKLASCMGASLVGIATCTAMLRETRILTELLRKAGFEVQVVGCKLESNMKADLNIDAPSLAEDCVICNPIMQALLLNDAKTDLNILMGICVGHDALFCKYSNAPAVTLVAKDFMTVHNPCSVLYAADSVYKRKLEKQLGKSRPAKGNEALKTPPARHERLMLDVKDNSPKGQKRQDGKPDGRHQERGQEIHDRNLLDLQDG